jgi:hypothetical protein
MDGQQRGPWLEAVIALPGDVFKIRVHVDMSFRDANHLGTRVDSSQNAPPVVWTGNRLAYDGACVYNRRQCV